MSAKRDNAGKPPLGYALTFPDALNEFARVCLHGEKKYSQWNYLASNKPLVGEYVNCLTRHLTKWVNGKDLDEESGLNHLAFVLWNSLALCQFALDKTGIDDRPRRDDKPTSHSLVDGVLATDMDKLKKILNNSVTSQILDNLAQGKEDVKESIGKIVPRYDAALREGYTWVATEDGKICLSLYDLGSYEMNKADFESRESSKIWSSKAKAEKAIDGMVLRGWAREV